MAPPSKRLTRSPSGAMDPQTQALIENLEILNGARGKGMDRAVLVRDLVDLDLAKIRVGAGGVIIPTKPGSGGGDNGGIQVDPPEAPRGVKANGGFSTILVEWDKPSYSGHAYAEILRADSDDFSVAVRISTTAANLISDQVGYGKTYYYWVRFVNLLDVKGPVQSTNGVRGQTQEDIGDILDKLQGQIDESFLTPEFNSKLTAIGDLTKLNEQGLAELEGKVIDSNERVDILSAEAEILAEAALEAATGVDNEGIKRRKVTAEIKLTQKTIVSELGAQALQILEITAKAGENSAAITETKNAVIKLDNETKAAVESITQRLDTQKSEIDKNTASITSQSETLVTVGQSVTTLTNRVDSQQSQIGTNTASITSQGQTLVTVGNQANSNTQKIQSVSETLSQLQSKVGENTANITTNSQTIVTVDGKANSAQSSADAANAAASAAQSKANSNGQSITVLSQQMTTLTSELNGTKSQVTQNSQTIATIDANGGTAYQAQWGVKASIGDIQAGIGLTVKKEAGKPDVSQCTVIAGQFSVGVASTAGAATVYPFIVANHPTTGQPGVFIDTAYIKAAKIQDLVAGEVIADNIKAAATLTAPYIKGGRIEIGSRFAVDENGNLTATNGNYSGVVNATGGTFNNVTINENCDVKGTLYAKNIIGNITSINRVNAPAGGRFYFENITSSNPRFPYKKLVTLNIDPSKMDRFIDITNFEIGMGNTLIGNGRVFGGAVQARSANGTVLKNWPISVNFAGGASVKLVGRDFPLTGDRSTKVVNSIPLPAGETVIEFWMSIFSGDTTGNTLIEVIAAVGYAGADASYWHYGNFVDVTSMLQSGTTGAWIT